MYSVCIKISGEYCFYAIGRRDRINALSRRRMYGPAVAAWLRSQNHVVFSVYDDARGMSDDAILQKAYVEKWILITNDRDFGEMIHRHHLPHHGVIFMRLADERANVKIETLGQLLANYSDQLADQFVVVTETRVRFARLST